MLGQPLGEIERARAAGIVRVEIGELGVECRIGLGVVVGPLQVEDQRHQRLGDEAAAENAEVPALVGAAAEGVELGVLRLVVAVAIMILCGLVVMGRRQGVCLAVFAA